MADLAWLISDVLGIEIERVNDELAYQSIQEWDSVRHVELMISLEKHFNVSISDELVVALRSVKSIQMFLDHETVDSETSSVQRNGNIHRGLEGIIVDKSSITSIDVARGELSYRGFNLRDLVQHSTFEETAWILIHGEQPTPATLQVFRDELAAKRGVAEPIMMLIRSLAAAHPVDVLRTAVSALGALDAASVHAEQSPEAMLRAGVGLIAKIPTIIAAHHAIRRGQEPPPPQRALSHAENFMYMLFAETRPAFETRFIEKDLIIHADHSSSASTFATRVAIGARSSVHAAVCSAIATFSGAVHGGAVEGVLAMLDAVGQPENAVSYINACFELGQPVMGFGHRVYRTEDPRVGYLREAARTLSVLKNRPQELEVVDAIVEAMRRYAPYGMSANVDLYAGVSYRLLGLPDDLATSIFVAGRIAGWIAHAAEQKSNNVLIRPLLHYVGPAEKTYVSTK